MYKYENCSLSIYKRLWISIKTKGSPSLLNLLDKGPYPAFDEYEIYAEHIR